MSKTLVTFLLDETGSMQSIKDDTIGGFNNYLATLKAGDGDISFTLLKFDSNRVEKVCVGKPIAEVAELTDATYRPGASTPLFDAAVKAIRATEEVAAKDPSAKIVVTIQTDGEENTSTEFKLADLAALVKEKTAAGWQFVFLGAGIDAYATGSALGFAASNTMSYGRGNSAQAFAAMGASTSRYAKTGEAGSLNFTAAEKRSAGDASASVPSPSGHVATAPKTARNPIVDDINLVA